MVIQPWALNSLLHTVIHMFIFLLMEKIRDKKRQIWWFNWHQFHSFLDSKYILKSTASSCEGVCANKVLFYYFLSISLVFFLYHFVFYLIFLIFLLRFKYIIICAQCVKACEGVCAIKSWLISKRGENFDRTKCPCKTKIQQRPLSTKSNYVFVLFNTDDVMNNVGQQTKVIVLTTIKVGLTQVLSS